MPRPLRSIWKTRNYARRRHRSWMLSMTLAALGWLTWWILFLARAVWPSWDPNLVIPGVVSTVLAVFGLGVALVTVRAQRSWMVFVVIPLFANAALLAMPWIAFSQDRPV